MAVKILNAQHSFIIGNNKSLMEKICLIITLAFCKRG